jgi:DNA-directed RNA polymerases I, II, and III subunit RPABC2
MITRFEYARILGARALQLSLGAPVLVKLPRGVDKRDTLKVAKYELEKNAVPIAIVRVFPDGEKQVIEPKLN